MRSCCTNAPIQISSAGPAPASTLGFSPVPVHMWDLPLHPYHSPSHTACRHPLLLHLLQPHFRTQGVRRKLVHSLRLRVTIHPLLQRTLSHSRPHTVLRHTSTCSSVHSTLTNAFPNLTEEHRSLVRRQLHALLEAGFTPLDYYTRDIRK